MTTSQRPPLRPVDLSSIYGRRPDRDDAADAAKLRALAPSFTAPAPPAEAARAPVPAEVAEPPREPLPTAAPPPAQASREERTSPPSIRVPAAAPRRPPREFRGKTVSTAPPCDEPSPTRNFNMDYPEPLFRALRMKAAERDVPMRRIVLEALRDAGYAVSDADIEDRRGAAMRSKSKA